MDPLREKYARLSEDRLKMILLEQRDYRREAIWTAELELADRGVSGDVITQLKTEGAERKRSADELAEVPLDWHWKAGYFLFCFLLVTPFVWYFYRLHADQGYERRSFESVQFVTMGILFYAAIATVLFRTGWFDFGLAQPW